MEIPPPPQDKNAGDFADLVFDAKAITPRAYGRLNFSIFFILIHTLGQEVIDDALAEAAISHGRRQTRLRPSPIYIETD